MIFEDICRTGVYWPDLTKSMAQIFFGWRFEPHNIFILPSVLIIKLIRSCLLFHCLIIIIIIIRKDISHSVLNFFYFLIHFKLKSMENNTSMFVEESVIKAFLLSHSINQTTRSHRYAPNYRMSNAVRTETKQTFCFYMQTSWMLISILLLQRNTHLNCTVPQRLWDIFPHLGRNSWAI